MAAAAIDFMMRGQECSASAMAGHILGRTYFTRSILMLRREISLWKSYPKTSLRLRRLRIPISFLNLGGARIF